MQTPEAPEAPIQKKPQPGEDWKTARGRTVCIDASSDPEVIQAHYLDPRAGGNIPVKFDLDGRKIGGTADWLVERQE